MENDDRPIGWLLSHRDALKLLGIGSASFLAACNSPQGTTTSGSTAISTQASSATGSALDCVVRPELTIGPNFVDDQLNRSDIRSEPSDNSVKEGVPLTLAIGVFDVANNSCSPLADAQVDIWHCDALGVYSGVSDQGFDTTGQKFLRGYQITDGTGKVQFVTIAPGWYLGRTVHIYLDNLAVLLSARGKGLSSKLIGPLLEMADSQKVVTYTDTVTKANVPLYEHFGFQCVEESYISSTGLSVFALLRAIQ